MPAKVPSLNIDIVPDWVGAQKNALSMQSMQQQNQLRGQKIGDYAEDRNYLRGERDYTQGQRPIMDARASRRFLQDVAPTLSPSNYLAERENMINTMGIDPSMLPSLEEIQDNAKEYGYSEEQAFKEWQEAFLPQKETEKAGWSAPKEGVDENGKRVMYQVNDKGESRIVSGISPAAKKGMKIYDRDGNLMVDMSGGEGPDVTRKTKGAIETKVLAGKEQLARMQTIQKEFKPEYLEIGTRLKATWTGIKARLGKDVSPEDAKTLTNFKKFQRKSIENINLYIKELTGAQMSEKEANRLRLAQPDPGENWWNGDDPITFKAKMDDVLKYTRAAIARWEYYRAKGLGEQQIKAIINSDTGLNLEDMAGRMQ